MAAARVRVLRVEQIAAGLDDRFRLLTGGSRAALPRHQTLKALIDWSHDLLRPPERVLLRRLAVFVGGWALAAAQAAGADEDEGHEGEGASIHASDVLELLTQLANKSLVAVERQPGHEARYHLLETIRQYALAKLTESGETDAVWRRLTEYYIELARTSGSTGRVRSIIDTHQRLEPERDNLRAALAWSQSAAGAEALGLRLAGAVTDSWLSRGDWHEAQRFLEGALGRAEGIADTQARAQVLQGLGTIAYFEGDYAVALTHLLNSLRLTRELNDHLTSGVTLARLGEMALEQDDVATAWQRQQESLALFREMANMEGVAYVLINLGEIAVVQEDATRAIGYAEESLALLRTPEKGNYVPYALNVLGLAAQIQGDYERARLWHEAGLALFRQDGVPRLGVPWAHQGLGETALAQGDAGRARDHFKEALRLFHEEGDRGGMSYCLAGLAGTRAWVGDAERAATLWGAAEALRLSIGARRAPATRATRERLMAAARAQLDEAAYAAAWAQGLAMTAEAAIALALEDGEH